MSRLFRMYLGAGLALLGAALFYGSLSLLVYAALLWVAANLFVRLYEEPTLARSFGTEYEDYRARVGRWLPRRPALALRLGGSRRGSGG